MPGARSPARDADFMVSAIALASRGAGRTAPNPSVGCLIVAQDRVVGRARTADGGRPHAEPQALAAAGTSACGATAYVTLEPCSHHGTTPPCVDALIAAGISRCVIALRDPDPRVSGRGIAALQAAGIEVTTGICSEAAAEGLIGYLTRQQQRRPFVTLKLATTLDGRIATQTGESRWITGPEARRAVHLMRSREEAVLIGSGTALADDPTLDVRGMGAARHPIRIVIDSRLRLPTTSRLAQTARKQPLWLIHTPDAPRSARAALEDMGAELIEAPINDKAGVDLPAALELLAGKGLSSILCEGGGALAASLLKASLADRIALFSAGKVIGAEGTPAVADMTLARLAEAPGYALREVRAIGQDTLSIWQASPTGATP